MPIKRARLLDGLKQSLRNSAPGIRVANAVLRDISEADLAAFLTSGCRVALPATGHVPELSVIVAVDERADLTLQCLRSLTHGDLTFAEVLCVGTVFSDATRGMIARFTGLKHLELPVGTGVTSAINRAASTARGDYILFVPNDVAVAPNTVPSVREMIRTLPDSVGAMGGMVIDARGRIREAGILIDQSGNVIKCGFGDKPLTPSHQFRRQVHCFLAAALLTRRDLFLGLGGFGERLGSVHVMDYCLRLGKEGKKILYDPALTVVDLRVYRKVRGAIFDRGALQELWGVSADHGHSQLTPARLSRLDSRKRILFIEDRVPHPNLGQGYPRSHLILTKLVEMGYFVTLYPLQEPDEDLAAARLDIPRDVEILLGYGRARLAELLAERQHDYDLIFVSRPHNMESFKIATRRNLGRVKGETKVIYDAEALFSNRDITLMNLHGQTASNEHVRDKLAQEVQLTDGCYSVISVSNAERAQFLRHGVARAYTLGHATRMAPTPNRFDQREDLLFVGGFSNAKSPNADGLLWFCTAVLPLLQQKLGLKVKLFVAGTTSLEGCFPDESVRFQGVVPDLNPFYNRARIFVAPIRYGAGIPLKVYDAAAHGLPVVTTPLLASQLDWEHEHELLVGQSEEEFACECAKLYQDESTWNSVRSSALRRISSDGSIETFSSKLKAIVDDAIGDQLHSPGVAGRSRRSVEGWTRNGIAMDAAPDETSLRPGAGAHISPSVTEVPRVALIILNWNGKDDTLECLVSVQQIKYSNFEIVVVDNGSEDGSAEAIRERFPEVTVIQTGENLGYAGGNNVGLRHALANNFEYVLLLNNDTIVDANILTAFVEATATVAEGGMFAAKIYYYSEPQKLWYAGVYLESPLRFVHIGEGQFDDQGSHSSIIETEYACGCALFVKTSVARRIGLLDERFFLTYEEVDWCYRAKIVGYKSFLAPKAKVWHKVSASFGGERSPLALYFFKRNTLIFARKHLTFGKRLAVYAHAIGEIAKDVWDLRPRFAFCREPGQSPVQAFYWSLLSYGRAIPRIYHNQPDLRAHLWGIRDFLLGRSGNCSDRVRSLRQES